MTKRPEMRPHMVRRMKSPILAQVEEPGGPHTPGAKKKRKKKAEARRKKTANHK